MTYVLDQTGGLLRMVEAPDGFRLEPAAATEPGEACAGRLVDRGAWLEIVPERRELTPAEAMREVRR